jgi:hypothetical protein
MVRRGCAGPIAAKVASSATGHGAMYSGCMNCRTRAVRLFAVDFTLPGVHLVWA